MQTFSIRAMTPKEIPRSIFLQIDFELKPLKWHVPIQSVRTGGDIVTRRARQTGRKDGVIYLTELHLVITQSSNPSKVVEGKEEEREDFTGLDESGVEVSSAGSRESG